MTLNGDVADDVRRARPHEGEADDFFRRLALAARRDPAPRALRDLAVAAHRLILRHAPSTATRPGSSPAASSPGSAVARPGSSPAASPPGSAVARPGSSPAASPPGSAAADPGPPPGADGNGHTGRPRLPNGRYAPSPPPGEQDPAVAVMEHLGHLAAEAPGEADALVPAAALVPLALPPGRSPDVVPGLLAATAALTRGLYSDPAIRPLVRLVPGLLRAAFDAGPDPVAGLAAEARRVLADPLACVAGYDRSAAADQRYHAAGTRP